MSFTDRKAWLNNPKLSNIERRKISTDIHFLASRLAEESKRRRQMKIEKEKAERRKTVLINNPSSRPFSARTGGEIKKLNPNQFALAAETEQRLFMTEKHRDGSSLLSPQGNHPKLGSLHPSIILINEAYLEIQTGFDTPASGDFISSTLKHIPLVEEIAKVQSGNQKTASEFGYVDLSPLGNEFSNSCQSLHIASHPSSRTSEMVRPNTSHDTKFYVADSNGKPCEWIAKDSATINEPCTYMDISQRPISARKGRKEKQHLSDSLPQYPDLTVKTAADDEGYGHTGSERSDFRRLHRSSSVFKNANPLLAKQRIEEGVLNDQRRKSSIAVRRPSTARGYQSGVVKDLRDFRRPSTASQIPIYEEFAPSQVNDTPICVQDEDF